MKVKCVFSKTLFFYKNSYLYPKANDITTDLNKYNGTRYNEPSFIMNFRLQRTFGYNEHLIITNIRL